jgi:hypothetical protein
MDNLEKKPLTDEEFLVMREEELKSFDVPLFRSIIVGEAALDQMISAHQLKYIENLIQTEEEARLLDENARDFRAYDLAVQRKALELAPIVQYDPDYLQRAKVDKELNKPILIAATISAKREEAKNKAWTVNYHARLIERLRSFKRVCPKKKTLLQRLLNK